MNEHLLSLLIFTPLLAALAVMLVPGDHRVSRGLALAGSLVPLALSLVVLARFQSVPVRPEIAALPLMQMVERAPWIGSLGIGYAVGIDGISLFLVLLTTVLTPIVIWSSWSSISSRVREYHVFLLILETGMLGAFLALDVFMFYVFWEAMLVPMYFLIGIWGGSRRIYAAVKFFLYTAIGSLLMLLAMLFAYFQTGAESAFLGDLMSVDFSRNAQMWLFAAFGLAFAIKVPMFPLHTWLPDAHVEAPTGGSVILAGVLLKMGTYGFLRWSMPLFPEAAIAFKPLILTLGAAGIIYGALVALVQPDMKRLVAYSSVSHLGFVMLGLFALTVDGCGSLQGSVPQVSGAVLQMVNHGLSTGALFLLVGILYERRHTREIAQYGGIARSMPMFAAILLYVTLSSIGLPGLNGFVGEFLILLGAFGVSRVIGVLGTLGVVLGAVYMLWLYQRVALGGITREENRALPDATRREVLYLLPVLAGILFIGIYPEPFLSRIEPAVNATLSSMQRGAPRAGNAAAPQGASPIPFAAGGATVTEPAR